MIDATKKTAPWPFIGAVIAAACGMAAGVYFLPTSAPQAAAKPAPVIAAPIRSAPVAKPTPVVQVPAAAALPSYLIVACATAIHTGRAIREECGDERTYEAGDKVRREVEAQMQAEADARAAKAEAAADEQARHARYDADMARIEELGREGKADADMRDAQMALDVAIDNLPR